MAVRGKPGPVKSKGPVISKQERNEGRRNGLTREQVIIKNKNDARRNPEPSGRT